MRIGMDDVDEAGGTAADKEDEGVGRVVMYVVSTIMNKTVEKMPVQFGDGM